MERVGAKAFGPEALAIVEVEERLDDVAVRTAQVAGEFFGREMRAGLKHEQVRPRGVFEIRLQGLPCEGHAMNLQA